MIRYSTTKTKLEALINAQKADWLARAKTRTDGFRMSGKYQETSSIWSEVKPVYMRLQGNKCAYCEREMESVDFGKVEQDVEHFRPKGNIRAWKVPKSLLKAGITVSKIPASGSGYYLLPYHPFNYAAACKPCNSILKKDYFPISGKYDVAADDPNSLAKEKAYLLYPIGDVDDDPETIIKFHGTSPLPANSTGFKFERALVTIEFFKLDDTMRRKNLFRDRAILILALYPLLTATMKGSAAARASAKAAIDGFLKPGLRHLNCAKGFKQLYERNPAEAKAIYDAATKLVTTIS